MPDRQQSALRTSGESRGSGNHSLNRVSIERLNTDAKTNLSRDTSNETKTAKIHFEGTIDLKIDDQLDLSTLARQITDLDLEATLLDETVSSLNKELVSDYCGTKHARGNGAKRYQRASTSTRSTVTTIGEHEFTLHYIKDTNANEENDKYF